MKNISCPVCGSENVWLSAYEDGGGDYGDELTPWYECGDCDASFSQDEAMYVEDGEDHDPEWIERNFDVGHEIGSEWDLPF